jgi:hypothetical protein
MGKQKYPNTSASSADGTPVRKGREHYSFEKKRKRLQARADAADRRNGAYEALSVIERIGVVHTRKTLLGGESKRELARLNALLAKEKAPAVKPAPLTAEQKAAKAVKRAKGAAAIADALTSGV